MTVFYANFYTVKLKSVKKRLKENPRSKFESYNPVLKTFPKKLESSGNLRKMSRSVRISNVIK